MREGPAVRMHRCACGWVCVSTGEAAFLQMVDAHRCSFTESPARDVGDPQPG